MTREPTTSSEQSPAGNSVAEAVEPPSDNPYQPPDAPAAREVGPGDISVDGDGFKPARQASMAATVALGCTITVSLFAIYTVMDLYWISSAMQRGTAVSPDKVAGAEQWVNVVDVIARVLVIITAVPFLIWFHRCYRNLTWLYVQGTKYSTGWAVGGWFIPFVNLFRPYQVAREIWDASNPDMHPNEGPSSWILKRSAQQIQVWWFLWLAPGLVWTVARTFHNQPSVEKWKIGIGLIIIGYLLNISSAAVTILLIRRLNARQAERHDRLRIIQASHPLAHLEPQAVDPTINEVPVDTHDEAMNEHLRRKRRRSRRRR